uniref:C-type lectin domain-containing protein n=1 Tax=Oryzias latipes TaxID=8090 RepID=H2LBG8_ORYLA
MLFLITFLSYLNMKRLDCRSFRTVMRGRRFSYFSSPKTWAQAEKFCQSIGANLASVRNRFENRKLLRLIKKKQGRFTPTWIGGSDAQTNGIWFWSDGSNYQYTNCGIHVTTRQPKPTTDICAHG